MGFWGNVKRAINSTVGTKDFRPLNEIVEDEFGKVVKAQNDLKTELQTGENQYNVEYANYVKNFSWETIQNSGRDYIQAENKTGIYIIEFEVQGKGIYNGFLYVDNEVGIKADAVYGITSAPGVILYCIRGIRVELFATESSTIVSIKSYIFIPTKQGEK